MKLYVLSIVTAALFLSACEETTLTADYQKEIVVNGNLEEGRSIDTIKVQWTGEVDKEYIVANQAVVGAIVIVKTRDGSFIDTLVYDLANPGRYYSNDPNKKIKARQTYELYIKTLAPDVRIVTGTTTVPDTFSIASSTITPGDTVQYNPLAPPNNFTWTSSNNHATYLPTISSLDVNAAMIPKFFIRDTLNKDFRRPDKVGYRVGLPKEQQNTELPWIFLNYFGNTRFDVYAVDFNYSDFLNQIVTQGGELKETRYNLNGGIGVFGSQTKAKGGFTIYLKQ
ncbi:MAG: hypothetical protein Q8L88_16690 [Bacteroidota bacterium]|nr:hypothetical protein [Bacteroidota bacterium]